MTQSLLRRLGVRDQNLSSLSMCKADKQGIEEWLNALPSANIGETTKQLYALSDELQRLQTPADSRLQIIEAIAPKVSANIKSLSKHYQHKQALLPSKAQQVIELTHALNMSMANNFAAAAVELSQSKSGLLRRPNKPATARAICGTMDWLKQDLVLCYQLYSPASRTLWYKLHQLYLIACDLDILTEKVGGKEIRTSVEELYGLCLLQGSIKANQLRQDDLMQVVDLMPEWLPLISLQPYQDGEIPALFVVNGDSDRGPVYSHLLNKDSLAKCQLQLSTSELVQNLRQLVDDAQTGTVNINGTAVRVDLLNHLILAWGKCTKRSFMRIESDEELDVCVGLGAAHSFAAGDISLEDMKAFAAAALAREAAFEEFHSYDKLYGPSDDESQFEASFSAQNVSDGSVECIDYSGNAIPGQGEKSTDEELFTARVRVNNASPGGYSLTLPENSDFRIHAGDLIGIKDAATELWSIAAIRWLHRPTRTELTFGVELLSPAYTPSIARIISTENEPGAYIPVLILPEVSVTEQAASLLVTDSELLDGQCLQILQRDQIRMIRVREQLAKTRVYGQYAYERFDAANDGAEQPEDLFDALWGNL